MQKQIKITVSEKLYKIIEAKAKKLGVRPTSYCYNVVLSKIREELEKNEK